MEKKRHRHTAEEILDNLRLVAKEIGHRPTIKEYESHPLRICGESSINRKFGSFWKGLKAAGFDISLLQRNKNPLLTDKEIIDSLQNIANELGHSPTAKEYGNSSLKKVSSGYLQHHFGSYNNALKAAGLSVRIAKRLGERYNKKQIFKIKTKKKYQYSNKQIIQNLQDVANDLGRAPSINEYEKHPLHIMHSSTIYRRFKTWINALEQANLSISVKSMSHKLQKNNKDTSEYIIKKLMDDLYNNVILHPNMPLSQIIATYCSASINAYSAYIGPISAIKKMLLDKYGIKIKESRICWTQEIVQKEFCRIKKLLNKVPTIKEMEQYSMYKSIRIGILTLYGNYTTLVITMGCKSHNGHMTQGIQDLKQKYYISLLQKTVQKQDTSKWPLYKFLTACNVSYSIIHSTFGSTKEWFKKAHIKRPRFVRNDPKFPIYTEALPIIRNLKKCARDISKIPEEKDYRKYEPRICSSTTIINRFGTWDNALKAAGLR